MLLLVTEQDSECGRVDVDEDGASVGQTDRAKAGPSEG